MIILSSSVRAVLQSILGVLVWGGLVLFDLVVVVVVVGVPSFGLVGRSGSGWSALVVASAVHPLTRSVVVVVLLDLGLLLTRRPVRVRRSDWRSVRCPRWRWPCPAV